MLLSFSDCANFFLQFLSQFGETSHFDYIDTFSGLIFPGRENLKNVLPKKGGLPKFSLGSKKDMHLPSTQPLQLLLQLVPAGLAIMKYLSPTSIVFGYVSIEEDLEKMFAPQPKVVFFGCV